MEEAEIRVLQLKFRDFFSSFFQAFKEQIKAKLRPAGGKYCGETPKQCIEHLQPESPLVTSCLCPKDSLALLVSPPWNMRHVPRW